MHYFASQFSILFVIFWALVGILFYFIPSLVALHYKRKHRTAIFLINLFLGWTVLGWSFALLWAILGEKTISKNFCKATNTPEQIKSYFELKEQGIITEEEFEAKKKELL